MPAHRRILRWGFSVAATIGLMTAPSAWAQDAFDSAAKSGGDTSAGNPDDAKKPSDPKADEKKAEKKAEPQFVRKSLREWQLTLPRGVFEVTRLKATEPPFSGKYAVGHFEGTFVCACCDAELFSSKAKFDSGTGWPSFWQPIKRTAIATAADYSAGEPRVEVECRRCGAHLGHVFDDAPATPTGLRFCINSLSLKLEESPEHSKKSATSKTRTRGRPSRTRNARGSSKTTKATESKDAKTEASDTPATDPKDEKPR